MIYHKNLRLEALDFNREGGKPLVLLLRM